MLDIKLNLRKTRWLTHVLLILFSLALLYPLLWMVSSSFKPETIIFDEPGLWPSAVTLENYTSGWTGLQTPFTRFFRNSFIIVSLATLGAVISSSLTAFAFARLDFRYKRLWFTLMMMTLMLPGHVTLVPQYVIYHRLDWINTILPLTLPHFFGGGAFFIFLNVQFIRGIPRDLDDAAAVDGANKWHIYSRIIFPLSMPALITTAIFSFIWTWNDFLSQLLYLNQVDLFTVPLALRQFVSAVDASSYGDLFAMSVLSLVPIFVFFIAAQKYLVEGISTTGFKG